MPKAEWGVKRVCTSCRVRFYDLMREPIVCPSCGAELDISSPVKPKRVKPGASEKTAAKPAAPAETEDLIDEEDDLDEDLDTHGSGRRRDGWRRRGRAGRRRGRRRRFRCCGCHGRRR
ncbi:MAG: TIGR02300 family protein [Xanthomonadales bacterium]|nr:TIGR02300 family protein [Xanthomonadales bacterium]